MNEISRVAAGAKGPLDWLASGRGPVELELAVKRAVTCLGCKKNGLGPLTQWFTEPASALIRMAIERRTEHKLATPYDAALGVCTACFCPLPTKVHEPIDLVVKHLLPEARAELWDKCWILSEEPPATKEP